VTSTSSPRRVAGACAVVLLFVLAAAASVTAAPREAAGGGGRTAEPGPAFGTAATATETAPPAGAGGHAAAPVVEALSIAEVPVAAKKELNRLRHLETAMRPDPDEGRIETALPPVAAYLARLQSQTAALRLEDLAPRDLEDAATRWRRHEAEVDEWQKTLERRIQELDRAAAELRATRAGWERTRAAATAAEAPAALVEQIDDVLRAVSAAQETLAARFDRVVTTQGRVGELVDLIDGVVARIGDVRHEQDLHLYRAEAPSLLSALRGARGGAAIGGQVRDTGGVLRAAAGEFLASYGKRMPWHAVLFLLTAVLLAGIGRAARRLEGDDPEAVATLEAARHILDRPVSAAFILALFMARPFYPLAPPPVMHGLMLAALLPVLRVLPRIVWPEMRGPLWGLALLVGLREASMVASEGTLLHRLLLLAVSLLGFAAAFLVAAPGGRGAARRGGAVWNVVLVGTRIALVVLAAAVLANVSGRVWLADRLASATILTSYAALLLFAGVMVLDGVVVIGLRQAGPRRLASVRNNGPLLRRRIRRVLDVAAIAWWVSIALGAFRIREPVLEGLRLLAATPLEVGSLRVSLGDLLTFATAIVIAVLLSRFVRFVLSEDILPPLSVEPGVRPMMLMLVHYIIVGLGVIFGIAAAGFPVDRLTLLISALGVGVGFGLQNLVNNFVSGLSLIFERPIRIGDQVQVGALVGRVESIGLRATVVRTVQGSEVIVPNADLITKEVTNWTLSDRLRRIEIAVGVAYGTDPEKVIALLGGAARGHTSVLPDPPPVVVFQRFGESSLDFALRFWTIGDERWATVESEVRIAVSRALAGAGIAIPFPQREMRIVSGDPSVLPNLGRPAPGPRAPEPPATEPTPPEPQPSAR
jgi:potassium-dependent mechanosensitive channel